MLNILCVYNIEELTEGLLQVWNGLTDNAIDARVINRFVPLVFQEPDHLQLAPVGTDCSLYYSLRDQKPINNRLLITRLDVKNRLG